MAGGRFWTNKDWDLFRKNAPNMTVPELSKLLGRSKCAIFNLTRTTDIRTKGYRPFRKINKDFFKTWSNDMAYVLGYWFADGNIDHGDKYRFRISSNDLEILEKIRGVMDSTHKIGHRKNSKEHGFGVTCREIYEDVVNLGGTERKSLIAKFPNVPDKYVRHFIRGYFDGDGGIRLTKHNAP